MTALGLPRRLEKRLTSNLDAASKALSRPGQGHEIARALEAFVKEVQSMSGGSIPEESTASLLEFAPDIASLADGTFS